MIERSDRPPGALEVVAALGRELESALERERKARIPQRAPFRGSGRALALAVGAALAIAAGAGAAGGIIPVGSVIPGGEPTGAPEYRLAVDETILATGAAPVAGPWHLSAYRSEGTADEGEAVEPEGLRCLRVILSQPPRGTPLAGAGFCGEQADDGFKRGVLPVRDRSGRAEVLVFGQAPEDAAAVELIAGGARVGHAEMYDGPEGYPGDLWVIVASPKSGPAEVRWIGPDGRPASTSLDVDIPPPPA